jgi:hypothetical protein
MSTKTKRNASATEESSSRGRGDKYRLQLEFTPDARDRLEEIRIEANAQSFAEVIRDALRLYAWFRKQRKDGFDIALVRGKEPVRVVELLP